MKSSSDDELIEKAIRATWPSTVLDTPLYAGRKRMLAAMLQKFPRDKFDLYFGIREPRSRVEKWSKQAFWGEMSHAEFASLVEADAKRPIDEEMLEVFHNAVIDDIVHYSSALANAVRMPSDTNVQIRSRENEIKKCVGLLRYKMPLWQEQIGTALSFLEETRVLSKAGLAKMGGFEAVSVHWLALQAFNRLTDVWEKCSEISERSRRRDSRYAYATTAIELFRQTSPNIDFPNPQSLHERLREEFILARHALRMSTAPKQATRPDRERNEEIETTVSADSAKGDSAFTIDKMREVFREESKRLIRTAEQVPPEYLDALAIVTSVDAVTVTNVAIPLSIPEKQVRKAFEALFGEAFHAKDSGVELCDTFTLQGRVKGRSCAVAAAFKGPGNKTWPVQVRNFGKRGDQIGRLFDVPADVYIIQANGPFDPSLVKHIQDTADAHAGRGRTVRYILIDGIMTARILQASNHGLL